jgi:hypothetical protein
LREERRLRVFVNRAQRRIFGPKRDKITWKWRKLYNEEFNDIYSSPNIIQLKKSRRMKWMGHTARILERREGYRILVTKLEGKRPLGIPSLRPESNIEMYFQEVR